MRQIQCHHDIDDRRRTAAEIRKPAKTLPLPPPSKVARAVSAAAFAAGFAMRQLGRFEGQDFLGLVDFGIAQFFQTRDFVQRQIGEQFQETPDIGIVGIAPELPVIIGLRRSA